MRDKISACLTVGNEEGNIRRCLNSLYWTDEIVVVDSFSKDKTAEICKEYTDRVYQHEWLGYVGQKELIKKTAVHPWILFIDADEEVSPDLRDQILKEFESGNNQKYVGYEFPRKVFFLGTWITHGEWWPDIKMRLFRKDKGICTGQEPHDHVIVTGPVKRLSGCLYHYTYDNISDQIHTLNRFSTIAAASLRNESRCFSIVDLLFRPGFRFIKGYIFKRGFMDGYRGFIIAILSSIGVFYKYAKLWELTLQKAQRDNQEKSEVSRRRAATQAPPEAATPRREAESQPPRRPGLRRKPSPLRRGESGAMAPRDPSSAGGGYAEAESGKSE